jgi:hypothetical protein
MSSVVQQSLADDALLKTYRGGKHPERWGHYGDCFSVHVDVSVTLSQFVFALYTSPVFRIERWILRVLVAVPSSDEQAREVAEGNGETFAVWKVGERTATQLLMCDRYGKTRSWFRVVAQASGGTVLQFGSAVAARPADMESVKMNRGFGVLLGLHRLYSRALLAAARQRVLAAQVRGTKGVDERC